jgi:phosphatidylserine synthase
MLYAYAFYVPEGPSSWAYRWLSWLGNLPLQVLFPIEIIFLIITFGSIAGYSRKYGTLCLDELCFGDESLRRRILSFFPNSLTVMNAMMGILAVGFAAQMRISEAYLMLVGAAVFDRLDGAVARRLGLTEPSPGEEIPNRITVGGILDDVADTISFCIAPALIFYLVLSASSHPAIQNLPIGIMAVGYGICGIARLVYFTLDRNPVPGFFKGMPTPAAALLVAAPLIMFTDAMEAGTRWEYYWGIFSFANLVLAAVVMNLYPVHYIHVGRFMEVHPRFGRAVMILVVVCVFTPYFGHSALLALLLYVFSPLITWRIDPSPFVREKDGSSLRKGGSS